MAISKLLKIDSKLLCNMNWTKRFQHESLLSLEKKNKNKIYIKKCITALIIDSEVQGIFFTPL